MASTATPFPAPQQTGSTVSETPRSYLSSDSDNYVRRTQSTSLNRHDSGDSFDSSDEYPPRRRSSVFTEVGLQGDDAILDARLRRNSRPKLQVRFRSKVDIHETKAIDWPQESFQHRQAMPPYFPTLPRLLFVALVIALILPSLGNSPFFKAGISPIGASAGPIEVHNVRQRASLSQPERRQSDPVNICKRWAGQSAVVNGTLYYYGGQLTTSSDQISNEWNNNFLTLDLTKSWQRTTPQLTALPQPSGPPAVALAFLWNSYDALYLYGGEFSDEPIATPTDFETWQYDISSKSWTSSSDPQTASGTNSGPANEPVQRAAEGAGVSVPQIGRGFYFGGHLDFLTTPGWSIDIYRLYLTSLLEYTYPGYSNPTVNSDSAAGSAGIYRNITDAGTQSGDGFPERADGVLIYIPGYSKSGILLGLGGGTNTTFTQMNNVDVYDIATSTWYKQATSGPTPKIRVNPCAVALSAADGSSTQVYMYGGQNLLPARGQTQYSDMWILTVPSFTWIQVDTSSQSVPPARAGHTCNVWNSQIVVVGGYVGQQLSCDSPGIYIFNASSLSWQNTYTLLSGSSDDPLNRQSAQANDSAALQGSYGYSVPDVVQKIIGGNAIGSATVTQPANTATQGPLATGSPITYTVTGPGGAVVTETGAPTTTGGGDTSSSSSSGPNKGAIIAGVIAGFFAVLAAYLGFCAWIYRKQLKLYKNHVAMAQRQQLAGNQGRPFWGPIGKKYSDKEKSQTSSDMTGGKARSSDERGSSRGGDRRTPRGEAAPPLPHQASGGSGLASNNPYKGVMTGGAGGGGAGAGLISGTANSSTEDLLRGQEPSFLGVVLNPRRSLRVVNRD